LVDDVVVIEALDVALVPELIAIKKFGIYN
jgi:hypothetical protein